MASLGPRFLTAGANSTKCVIKSPLLAAALPSCTQIANLRSINNPFPLPPRKKPFTGKFNPLWQLVDTPIRRMNENSIVVIVEGNIGTGKTALAKKLAKEFDLLYVEDINYDELYLDRVMYKGFNPTDVNPFAPNRIMFNNLETFWATEKLEDNPLIMRAQFDSFHQRWLKYRDALKHICNTGQGVIMSRNMYSDIVFCYAMLKKKLFKNKVHKAYDDYTTFAFKHLWFPHLLIYLDATPAYCLKKIKERNVPFEVNSPLLKDEEFLSYISEGYDKHMLPKFEANSEVMVLEADDLPDFDLLVEELEKIDFNPFRDNLLRDDKFKDWRLTHDRQWASFRLWADDPSGHLCACPRPDHMVDLREIQHTIEEFTVFFDYMGRKNQYYYDQKDPAGKDGMVGAMRRFIMG